MLAHYFLLGWSWRNVDARTLEGSWEGKLLLPRRQLNTLHGKSRRLVDLSHYLIKIRRDGRFDCAWQWGIGANVGGVGGLSPTRNGFVVYPYRGMGTPVRYLIEENGTLVTQGPLYPGAKVVFRRCSPNRLTEILIYQYKAWDLAKRRRKKTKFPGP